MTYASTESLPPEATAPQPIRGWVLLATPVAGVLVFLVALTLLVLAAFLVHAINLHGGARGVITQLQANYLLMMGIAALLYLAILFAAWLLLPKQGPASLQSYFSPVPARMLAAGVGSGVLLVVLVLPVLVIASKVFHIDLQPTARDEALVPHNLIQLFSLLIMGAVTAPLAEELYFRGLFLRWLRKRWSLVLSAIVNVVIFAVLHGRFIDHPGLGGFAVTAGLCVPAIVLVILAVRSGSLWPGVIAHGTYNAILLTLSYVQPNLG